jgi:hypothetical protein
MPSSHENETCKWLLFNKDAPWEPDWIPFDMYEEAALASLCGMSSKDCTIFAMKKESTALIMSQASAVFDDMMCKKLTLFSVSTSSQ